MLETTVIIGQMNRKDWNPVESYDRSLFLVKANQINNAFYWIIVSQGSGYQYASVGSAHVIKLVDKDL